MKKLGLVFALLLWTGCHSTGFQPAHQMSTHDGVSYDDRLDRQAHQPSSITAYRKASNEKPSRSILVTNSPLSLDEFEFDLFDAGEGGAMSPLDLRMNRSDATRAGFALTAEEYYLLGVVALEASDFPQALSDFRHARRLEPMEGEFLAAEVECLWAMNRWEEARSVLDQAPTPPNDRSRLADLKKSLDRIEFLRQDGGLEGVPAPAEGYGLLLAELGRHEEAVALLDPLEQSGSAGLRARIALARSLLSSRQPQRAQSVMERLVRDGSQEPDHVMLLSHAIVASTDTDAARRYLAQFSHQPETRGTALLLQGFLHLYEQKTDQAINDLRKAVRVNPADTQAHCLLASIYEQADNRRLARRHYRLALQIDPHCTQAKKALAKIELKRRPRPNRNPTFG